MKVNFDNMRLSAVNDLSDIIRDLEDRILENEGLSEMFCRLSGNLLNICAVYDDDDKSDLNDLSDHKHVVRLRETRIRILGGANADA